MNTNNVKKDIMASVVVFLVALPLCLGIALASGAPLFSGLISGIIGGIVVGSLSKSHLSVSGPAAGLVVIVLGAIQTLGSYQAFLVAVVLAGLLQLLLGYLKAGIVGLFFPSSIIKGMLSAIGLILILKQIPHLIGFDSDAFGEMDFLQQDGSNTLSSLINSFDHIYAGSMIVGIISIGLLIMWDLPLVRHNRLLKQIPGGLLVVVIGVIFNQLFMLLDPHLAIAGSHLVSIPVISGIDSMTSVIQLPDFHILGNSEVYVTAITLAIVASLETLLSIEAVDKIDPMKRRTPQNAELKAQGIGNILSGLTGGLPITAVIVRSSANLHAGAKTKLSAILHGVLLIISVLFIPHLLNQIPLASLAAILIMVGYKLTKPSLYLYQYRLGREQFIPFLVTIVAILFTDLLVGISIGMSIGVFYILRANYKVPYHYDEEEHPENGDLLVSLRLSEHVSFLNKAGLQLTLEGLPSNSQVTIDGSMSKQIDHDSLEIIHHFKSTAHEKNISLTLKDIPEIKLNAVH